MISFKPYKWPAVESIPPRDFLYCHDYIRGFVSATVAPGGAAKTATTITEALSMAAGLDLLNVVQGRPEALPVPLRVCLWNLEDDKDEMARRLAAAQIHFADHIKGTGYEKRLVIKSAESPLVIAALVDGAFKADAKLIAGIIDGLIAAKIDVLIVDPFVSSHNVMENDNDLIDKVVKEGWARIAREAGCAVMLVHHVRKGGRGQVDFDINDARGAGALINAVRLGRVINRMDGEAAKKLGVHPDAAWAFLRVDPGKANLAPPMAAVWRHLASVDLPNGDEWGTGDSVGVVEGWVKPEGPITADSDRAQIIEKMGGRAWRRDSRARGEWVGVIFAQAMQLDPEDSKDRSLIAAHINEAIKAGWLREGMGKNAKRQPVPIVTAKQRRSHEDILG